mmetsp:Transcript_40095/g.99095  ORF Transcript_40095/g.99095 Transcript_40095/m.99095 type:complete len:815 (-) Transcript_40095:119-2563(-)
MDLSLTRIDLLNADTTKRGCLCVLPLGKKNPGKTQKIVIGDQSGTVHCFGMKKGDVSSVFKVSMERPVSRVELGGMLDDRDKIFVAGGQMVKAWSRKGREFLKFNTNLSEEITSMHVLNDDIYTGGEFMYNQFRTCKDLHSLMANDRINDLTAIFCTPGSAEPSAVLACQDRAVRVLNGSEILYEGSVDGPVLTVTSFSSSSITVHSALSHFNTLEPSPLPGVKRVQKTTGIAEMIYGTENGIFGQLLLDDNSMRRGWEVGGRSVSALGKSAQRTGRRGGGITALTSHDLTHDGVADVIVGRDDGALQVYSFDVSSEPKLCFESSLTGSVTAAEAGLINSANFDEIVISTYSGQILSYSSEPSTQIDLTGDDGRADADDADGDETAKPSATAGLKALFKGAKKEKLADVTDKAVVAGDKKGALQKRVKAVKKEIETLQKSLEAERAKYQSSVSGEMIGVQSDVKMRDSFALSEEEASYRLQIEISKPLDFVLLQSDVPMEVLDSVRTENGEELNAVGDDLSSSTIVSRTKVGQSNLLLATYRVTDNSTRITVRLRTIEGRYGSLTAYVVPKGTPKTAQAATYQIKPLSLHRRISTLPDIAGTRPMCELRLSGSFSLSEMHSWVYLALPEVPERVGADDMSFVFASTFLGTFLVCNYKKGDALFKSDNLTTLTTLKEVIGREATQRKVQVKTAYDVKEESIASMLKLIDPMLTHQSSLAHRVALIDTLKEVEQQESDISFLDPAYVDIVHNAATIRAEFAQMPRQLDYLVGIVIDLYVDKNKFRGVNVQHRLGQLDRLLRTEYSLDAVLQFFREI